MREIKFKYGFTNHVEVVLTLAEIENGESLHNILYKGNGGRVKYRRQYTGLKDANGVEIYEGDKCEITFEDGQKNVMTVVFERARFHLKGNGFWSLNNTQNIKVIGNIHDNPELLEAS